MGYNLLLLATVLLVEINGVISLSPPWIQTCKVEGKVYHVGEHFIPVSCRGRCTCRASGRYTCVSLCLPVMGSCVAGTMMSTVRVMLPNSKCSCARLTCLKRKCPPCAMDSIRCKPAEKVVSFQVEVKGHPGCSCRRHKCIERALGRCQKAVANVDGRMLGAFTPKCKSDGSYEEKQCHGSTGHCWCVESSTGKEIPGSRKGPGEGKTKCGKLTRCQRRQIKPPGLIMDWEPPRCNPNGTYAPMQCIGLTGYCWCVDGTGKTIPGSGRRRYEGKPNCGKLTRCQRQQIKPDGPIMDWEPPRCKPDGTYAPMQCIGLTGYCWCVDGSGKTIPGSGRGRHEGKPDCATSSPRKGCIWPCRRDYRPVCGSDGKTYGNLCTFKIARCKSNGKLTFRYGKCKGKLTRCQRQQIKPDGLIMDWEPRRCNPDGSYAPMQCTGLTGYCWCVDGSGKTIPRSGRRRSEGKPDCGTSSPRKGCIWPCRRNYRPVCGSDGKTYGNLCTFKIARCKSNGKLTFRHGKCKAGYCLHKGKKYLKGQRFTMRCNSCTCMVGRGRKLGVFACTRRGCPRPGKGYVSVGCWRDTRRRAIPTLEGGDRRLSGSYRSRLNAINKCYQAAKARGFQYFALQNGGWCASSKNAKNTYRRYGRTKACKGDGEGGPWANRVYRITGYRPKRILAPSKGCARPCRRNYRPVCGSDGKTYGNLCTFKNARCRSYRKLTFRYGRCRRWGIRKARGKYVRYRIRRRRLNRKIRRRRKGIWSGGDWMW